MLSQQKYKKIVAENIEILYTNVYFLLDFLMKYPVGIPKPEPRYFEFPAFPIMTAILIFTHTIPHRPVHVYLSI